MLKNGIYTVQKTYAYFFGFFLLCTLLSGCQYIYHPKALLVALGPPEDTNSNLFTFQSIAIEKTVQLNSQQDINTLLMNSTYKITGDNKVSGTIFILTVPHKFSDNSENTYMLPIMITAAHVLDQIEGDWATIDLRENINGNIVKVPTRIMLRINNKPLWTRHPYSDVAVAVIFLPRPILSSNSLILPALLATRETLNDYDIYPGCQLKILGYPYAIESDTSGFPILRSGGLASFLTHFDDKNSTFLVDYKVFPGDSGGPVYIHNPNWHRRNRQNSSAREIQIILGLVSEHIKLKKHDTNLDVNFPNEDSLSLAKVIPAKTILETIDSIPFTYKEFKQGLYLYPAIGPFDVSQLVPKEREHFINEAHGRLKGNIDKNILANFESKQSIWESKQTQQNWEMISNFVAYIAADKEIFSNVTVTTFPHDGATIKFQSVASRGINSTPTTANQLSTCDAKISIGRYYIWAERNGKPTTDMTEEHKIVKENESIQLREGNDQN